MIILCNKKEVSPPGSWTYFCVTKKNSLIHWFMELLSYHKKIINLLELFLYHKKKLFINWMLNLFLYYKKKLFKQLPLRIIFVSQKKNYQSIRSWSYFIIKQRKHHFIGSCWLIVVHRKNKASLHLQDRLLLLPRIIFHDVKRGCIAPVAWN